MAQAARTRRTDVGPTAAVASLRGNRPFQLLWLSNMFFFSGVWTQTPVPGWSAYQLTGSEFLVARLAPMFLRPLAGVLADRFNRFGCASTSRTPRT